MTSADSLRRMIRLFEQVRDREAIAEMGRFVRLSRMERGENVMPFPGRLRPIQPPANLPPAA